MPQFNITLVAPLAFAYIAACTAGGDVVPEGSSGGTGSAAAGTASTPTAGTGTTAGASGSSSSTAGTSPGTGGAGGGSAGAGTAGSVANTAGSGGTGVVIEDPYQAVKVFDNWRVDMECVSDPGKNFLSPTCQQGGDICWMKDDGGGRTTFTINKKVGGDPNKLYKFRVRIRGILEPKAFDPANCPPLFMGANDPMRSCKCTAEVPECIPIESGFNLMRLSISAPKQRYWMNNAQDSVSHRVEIIDGEFDMEARGQADVEYFFDNLNTGEIRNCQNKVAPDLPFVDGNFFVLTVLPGSVTAVDAM